MNCVLFTKMDQVFSKESKTLKKNTGKLEKKYWKSQGKVREFCQSGKVGTLITETRVKISNKIKQICFSNMTNLFGSHPCRHRRNGWL